MAPSSYYHHYYYNYYFHILSLSLALFIPITHQLLQDSQAQALLQIREHLQYPPPLQTWPNYQNDLCAVPATPRMSVKCEGDSVTELKIIGDGTTDALSGAFSMHALVATLTRLTRLRALALVSLGMWGPLPGKVHRLSSLHVLDLSSNSLSGPLPPRMAAMANLRAVTLDGNRFNGTLPPWLSSLPNLSVLSFKANRFTGPFPSSLCKLRSLADISFSHNLLSGELPDLSALVSLRVLDLRDNRFDSKLPSMPTAVVTVLLSNNSFSGEVPTRFGELGHLQHLDLSSNRLSELPPSALFSLPSISYLNLANNVLRGSLPEKLRCGGKLGFVDISGNRLSGGLPACLDGASDRRVVRYGGNCLALSSQAQRQGAYCEESGSGWRRFLTWKLAAAAVSAIVVVLALAVFLYRRCYSRERYEHEMLPKGGQDNSTTGVSSELLASARFISQAVKFGTQATSACRQFSIEELKDVTKNFDLSAYIGEGSIGKLYKAKLENGSYVVIRSVALSRKCSLQNLKARLDLLSKLQHPNLVSLLGHCIDGGGQDESSTHRLLLVYEHMPNGDYRSRLSEFSPEKALKWSDRLAILIGVAKAVYFLHTGVIPGCFGNRLKTNNILLDEHYIPKLSDYGISIIAENIEKEVNPNSCRRTKVEDDVYNFGLILFESLVGPIASEKGETFFLNEKASFDSHDGRRKIVDPMVLTTCSQESLSIAVSITTKCISPESLSRPSFEDVLWNLQYAAQVQATADTDQRSDSTS